MLKRDKPIAIIKPDFVPQVGLEMKGRVKDHPEFGDGAYITTNKVLGYENQVAETKDVIYKVIF